MVDVISADTVVSIHYTLRGEDKSVLDSSEGPSRSCISMGTGKLSLDYEKELLGKKVGDSVKAEVAPKDGYGEYDEELHSFARKEAIS